MTQALATKPTEPASNVPAVLPQWARDAMQEIASGLSDIANTLEQVSKVYARAVDRDPRFKDWISTFLPSVPSALFLRFERVGRGQLDRRIALGVPHAYRLESLPISDQRRALGGSLPLLVSDGSTLEVQLGDIGPDMASQLFAGDHIRTPAEQRVWIESQREKTKRKSIKTAPMSSQVVNINRKTKVISFTGPCSFTPQELMALAAKAMG